MDPKILCCKQFYFRKNPAAWEGIQFSVGADFRADQLQLRASMLEPRCLAFSCSLAALCDLGQVSQILCFLFCNMGIVIAHGVQGCCEGKLT